MKSTIAKDIQRGASMIGTKSKRPRETCDSGGIAKTGSEERRDRKSKVEKAEDTPEDAATRSGGQRGHKARESRALLLGGLLGGSLLSGGSCLGCRRDEEVSVCSEDEQP
jgi:hypothetical protein